MEWRLDHEMDRVEESWPPECKHDLPAGCCAVCWERFKREQKEELEAMPEPEYGDEIPVPRILEEL